MTDAQSLTARAGLASVVSVAGMALLSSKRLKQLSWQSFRCLVIVALPTSRLVLYMFVFFVLHIEPRGDVGKYYFPEAVQALHGKLPYRDFSSSYAPLHPFIDAAAVAAWRSPLALILFMILVESLLLPIWLKFIRSSFPEPAVRTAALLYLASPLSIQFVTIDGQNNIMIAVLLALGALLLYRYNSLLSGMAIGASISLIKFLPLIYLPAYFLGATRRMRWLLGLASVLVLGYAGFLAIRLPLLAPLQFEGKERTASCLPFLIDALGNLAPHPRLEMLLLAAGLGGAYIHFARKYSNTIDSVRLRLVVLAPVTLTLVLLLLSKKSWPNYLVLVLFPLCLVMGNLYGRIGAALFYVFNIVSLLAHSYWATAFREDGALEFRADLLSGRQGTLLLLGLQMALIAGYIWLLWASIREIRKYDP